MNNEPLIVERTYNAPIEKVWKAITDKDQMRQWFFDINDFKPEVGFEFQFGAKETGPKYDFRCTVMEVVPGSKVAYSWRHEGYEGNSVVTFELFDEGGQTRLKLTHTGTETFPQSNKDFTLASFNSGWTELLGTRLKNLLEKAA